MTMFRPIPRRRSLFEDFDDFFLNHFPFGPPGPPRPMGPIVGGRDRGRSKAVGVAEALFDNVAEWPDELTFRRGDVLKVLDRTPGGGGLAPGWWLCEDPATGAKGIAPANRLQLRTSVIGRRVVTPRRFGDVFAYDRDSMLEDSSFFMKPFGTTLIHDADTPFARHGVPRGMDVYDRPPPSRTANGGGTVRNVPIHVEKSPQPAPSHPLYSHRPNGPYPSSGIRTDATSNSNHLLQPGYGASSSADTTTSSLSSASPGTTSSDSNRSSMDLYDAPQASSSASGGRGLPLAPPGAHTIVIPGGLDSGPSSAALSRGGSSSTLTEGAVPRRTPAPGGSSEDTFSQILLNALGDVRAAGSTSAGDRAGGQRSGSSGQRSGCSRESTPQASTSYAPASAAPHPVVTSNGPALPPRNNLTTFGSGVRFRSESRQPQPAMQQQQSTPPPPSLPPRSGSIPSSTRKPFSAGDSTYQVPAQLGSRVASNPDLNNGTTGAAAPERSPASARRRSPTPAPEFSTLEADMDKLSVSSVDTQDSDYQSLVQQHAGGPPVTGEELKGQVVERHQVLQTAVTRLCSFVTKNWRTRPRLEATLGELQMAAQQVVAALDEFLDVGGAVFARAARQQDNRLAKQLAHLLRPLRASQHMSQEAHLALARSGWDIVSLAREGLGTDPLDRLVALARPVPDDAAQVVAFVVSNMSTITSSNGQKMTSDNRSNSLTSPTLEKHMSELYDDYDFIDGVHHQQNGVKGQTTPTASTPSGDGQEKEPLNTEDRELLDFYTGQVAGHIECLGNAIDAFLALIEANEQPKAFVHQSKFVVLAAHKLVYIADSMAQCLTPQAAWLALRLREASDLMCDVLRATVASTKRAAAEPHSVPSVQAMVDSMVAVSHIAHRLRLLIDWAMK